MPNNKKPKQEDLSELFSAIEQGFDGGTEPETTPPSEFEGQFRQAQAHGDTTIFDKTDYWDRKLQYKLDNILADCNRIGIPMQACVMLARTQNGVNLRHFKSALEVDETKAAAMVYHVPHGIVHMVLALASIPYQILGEGYPRDTPHFNHLRQWEEDIIPQVSVITGDCNLMEIPFQIGFVLVQTATSVETRGAVSGQTVGCDFVAAHKLYAASPFVIENLIDIFEALRRE